MKVEVRITDKPKYEIDSKIVGKAHFDIESFEIVTGEKAKEIEEMTDDDGCDEYHEYLVLHLTSGWTSTYRNSHADLFKAYA